MLFKESMTSLLILAWLLAWLIVMACTGLVIDLQWLDHVVFVDPIQQSHVGCVYINHPVKIKAYPSLYTLSPRMGAYPAHSVILILPGAYP